MRLIHFVFWILELDYAIIKHNNLKTVVNVFNYISKDVTIQDDESVNRFQINNDSSSGLDS